MGFLVAKSNLNVCVCAEMMADFWHLSRASSQFAFREHNVGVLTQH